MRLKILLPSHVLIDEPVQKIIAEGQDGSFCLKPRHIDFVSALTPGLFQFISESGEEFFIAMDEGILVSRNRIFWFKEYLMIFKREI